jgi:hypothetical protein
MGSKRRRCMSLGCMMRYLPRQNKAMLRLLQLHDMWLFPPARPLALAQLLACC